MNTTQLLPEYHPTHTETRPAMTPAEGAFQHRSPASLTGRDVCPHCKRETAVYLVTCDGHTFETHRCADHGDVAPMRSVIVNPW